MSVRPESKKQLLSTATRLLCRDALAGIGRMFRPDALALAGHGEEGTSRDTAYRLWPDGNQGVRDLASHVTDPNESGVDATIAAALSTFNPGRPRAPTTKPRSEHSVQFSSGT